VTAHDPIEKDHGHLKTSHQCPSGAFLFLDGATGMRYTIGDIEYSGANSPFTGPNGNKRYEIVRAILFALIGGEKCRWCHSTEKVQFDHINKDEKSFDIYKIVNSAFGKYDVTEVLKCQPLCVSCHNIKTVLERYPQPSLVKRNSRGRLRAKAAA
jgi:hypothetical protein